MSWNLSRTINNILFDIIDIQADVTILEGKTQNINEALPDETKFAGDIYADKYIINNDTSPPKKLYSDGSLTTQGDLIFLDSEPINQDVNRTYFDKSLNYYAASDASFPVPDALPTYYLSTVNISNENDLVNFCTTFSDRVEVIITQSFTISSAITVNTLCNKCKIRGVTQNVTLSCNLPTGMFNIYAEEISFDNITLLNSNTDANASILNFLYVGGTNYITDCIFRTNEFAITSISWYLQILNNFFTFFGTADTNRYILLAGFKEVFINNNFFQGNSLTSTQCVDINLGAPTAYLNGNLIMKNNVTDNNSFAVQCLLMVDIPLTNSNLSIYASNNTMTTTEGLMIFYADPLDGVKQIYCVNNTQVLGVGSAGSKGLIGLDSASNGIISFNTKIYSAKNIVPLLRPDYADLVNSTAKQERFIAYNTARFTPEPNKYDLIIPFVGNANTGSIIPVDISGLETKTQNLNATASLNTLTKNTQMTISGAETFEVKDVLGTSRMIVNNTNTTMAGDVTAGAFIKAGGTNQQYLMADGTALTYSSNSGNSNFYLYTSSDSGSITPTNGQITYNNAAQADATIIYISHVTSDNIDIEIYFKQLSTINEVYIQDRNLSENYIQYNIIGSPTITINSKVAIPVAVRTSGGTGTTSFGNTHPVLLSFFVNSIETDTRLSLLETKTQNLGASATFSTLNKSVSVILDNVGSFIVRDESLNQLLSVAPTTCDIFKPLNMNNNKISNVGTPTQNLEAVNKLYVDNTLLLKLNLTGGTLTGALNISGSVNPRLGATDIFNVTTSDGITGNFRVSNTNAIFYVPLSMNNNILSGVGTPLNNGDGTNKLYVDNVTAFKLNLSGGTMTGALNMGLNNISNANQITANSLTIGATGPITALSQLTQEAIFTTTITCGVNISAPFDIYIRRLINGTNSVVYLFFPKMTMTTPTGGGAFNSTSVLPANFRPLSIPGGQGYHLSICVIQNNATYSTGLLWIFPNGQITISSNLNGNAPANAPSNATWGLHNQHTVSYIVA